MIFKRGKTYWCRFGVDGHMFRQSLKTGDWQEAKRAERDSLRPPKRVACRLDRFLRRIAV